MDSANCEYLPDDIKEDVESDFEAMSYLGIDNDEDQNKYFMIRNHVPEIIFSVFKQRVNDKTSQAIATEVFKNRHENPISSLLELIEAIDLALKKMMPKEIRPKLAYPQPNMIAPQKQWDIQRWVSATRKIYRLMSSGHPKDQAELSVIGEWSNMEKDKYKTWAGFYTEKVPEKYPKIAKQANDHLFLANLPIGNTRAELPPRGPAKPVYNGTQQGPGTVQEIQDVKDRKEKDVSDVRDSIESQRRKLISRLSSAEKILGSQDGQLFAGDDQETMLQLLQELKRKIQIANKKTVKSSLFEDQIFKVANQLKFTGKNKAASFFYKVAQLPPPGGDMGLDMGMGGGMGDMLPGATPGGPPGAGGGTGETSGKGDKKKTQEMLKEFFDNLKKREQDIDDTPEEREEEKKTEAPPITTPPAGEAAATPAPVEVPATVDPVGPAPGAPGAATAALSIGNGSWLKTAQMPPQGARPPRAPRAPQAPPVGAEGLGDIEVSEPPQEAQDKEVTDNTDDVIDAALNAVSMDDVVRRLEMLVSIYNKREISRQLAVLDMMMDRLGIASYFPALGESMSKALEANQYIGNRLGDILAKIKGSEESSATSTSSEWIEVTEEDHPETAALRGRLDQEQQDEEKRKAQRKEKENAKLDNPGGPPGAGPGQGAPAPKPGEEVELNKPSRIEKAPKLDVR